jgi:hypothetical protein
MEWCVSHQKTRSREIENFLDKRLVALLLLPQVVGWDLHQGQPVGWPWWDSATYQKCRPISRRKPLRLYGLLLAGILTGTSVFAATDPFVGTWVYNADKSPKPTIKYAIKDLGGERYSLTGSTGVTVEVKADGVAIKTAAGATVSFKKLDDHDWKMVRDDGQKMVRTYNISPDDKTLTLHDVFAGDAGENYETTTKYARLSPGNSIFGEWQSVSMEEKTSEEAAKMIITPFETDGLSFSVPDRKHLSEMKFDGKIYAFSGAGDTKDHASSGKRINDHIIELDGRVNGKPEGSEELKVSDDGKTLTIVDKPANSPAVFTTVCDRQ